jgi:hypothetical protein
MKRAIDRNDRDCWKAWAVELGLVNELSKDEMVPVFAALKTAIINVNKFYNTDPSISYDDKHPFGTKY